MALTPIDVQQKTFGTALRGYDLDEVDDFLDEVVTSLKSYEERLVESQERIAALQAELEGKGDSESAISRALVTAQRSADALVSEAEAEAARIRQDAQAEADRVLLDARAERDRLDAIRADEQSKLDSEVAGLRQSISSIRTRVLELNSSIEQNLDSMEEAVDSVTPIAREASDEEAAATAGSVWTLETTQFEDEDESDEFEAPQGEATDEGAVQILPGETASEATVTDEPAWYERASDSAQELDLGLETDDEAAAAEASEGESSWDAPPADATTEMPVAAEDADPLDEAIADATFQGNGGSSVDGHDDEQDDGWSSSEAVEDSSDGDGEAWEEVLGSDEEDRPRRPWE